MNREAPSMMGDRLVMQESLFYQFRLDDHVPADHMLRAIDRFLDLDRLRRHLAPFYSTTGRPSIDPELMIRVLLVGYLGGIRSERRLCAEVHLNLAYRWFCRLGLDGAVPDHSTFSKNRHRRLPGGAAPEAWTADREAQARPVREYLDALDAASPPEPDEPRHDAPKYLSPTDPAAAWSNKHGVGVFAYGANLLVDTAHGIIVDVEATPARLSREIVAAEAMRARAEGAFGFAPPCLGADKSYGTGPFLAWLPARGVSPHIPVLDRTARTD